MSKKPRVQFIQNAEPSFIREFKERAGIPAADTIESKRKPLDTTDDNEGEDENRPEDEQPQLVYDPCSNVDELEARAFIKQWQYEHKLGFITASGEDNAKKDNLDVPNRIIFRSAEERGATTVANKANGGSSTLQLDIEGLASDRNSRDTKKKKKKDEEGDKNSSNKNEDHSRRSQRKNLDRDRSPLDMKRKDTKCSLLSFDLEEEEEG